MLNLEFMALNTKAVRGINHQLVTDVAQINFPIGSKSTATLRSNICSAACPAEINRNVKKTIPTANLIFDLKLIFFGFENNIVDIKEPMAHDIRS
jgi:hypothetical protein